MGRPGIHMWIWTLCVFWVCESQVLVEPQYMVAIPAVIEAGAESTFCASLLKPNETLVMTVTWVCKRKRTVLLKHSSSEEFHTCIQFKAPLNKPEVQMFQVEVQGDTFYSKAERKVLITQLKPKTFIQTDKPMYLPGQTVHFRVVSLDTKLRPANSFYYFIKIEDVNKKQIGMWRDKTANRKILQLSYPLNSEVPGGTYRIVVVFAGERIYQTFKVEKFVLPKFEVKIEAADKVIIAQEEIKFGVCAKYAYGQPVPGSVTVELCRRLSSYYSKQPGEITEPPCHKETKQIDKTGCDTFVFKMSTFTERDSERLLNVLDLRVNAEEEGTGVSRLQQKKIRISYVIGQLSFIDTPKVYYKGSNVEGKVKAVDYNNTPIPDMPLYLLGGERWRLDHLLNITTDSTGVGTFSLSTDEFSGNLHLYVFNTPILEYPEYKAQYYGIEQLSLAQKVSPETKTVSSLEVKQKDKPLSCDTEEEIFIQYTIVGESPGSVDVMYLVLSKGAIALHGHEQIRVPKKTGEVSFKLNVSPEMAPNVQVVAYAVLRSQRVIAHSAQLSIEKCFRHKVSVEFSPSSAVPGEETTMQITADPDSLCGVSAVDQSDVIKEPGKILDADKIFKLLTDRTVFRIPQIIEDPTECETVRTRSYVSPLRWEGDKSAHAVFQDVGLKMATNLITMPLCVRYKREEYQHVRANDKGVILHRPLRFSMAPLYPFTEEIDYLEEMDYLEVHEPAVHNFFPETWIWDLMEVGESGVKDVSFKVPDTITTWETEAFCLSPQGFGLAPRKEIKVFQPFILELTLPYSIIRGEHFELKATVFNYLTSCIMVSVTPAPSSDYTLSPLSGDQYTSCLCGNERKTVSWTMVPSVLGKVNVSVTAEAVASHVSCDNEVVSVPDRGRVDVVTKSLVVKADGTEMTKNYNWLLCPKGEVLAEELDVQLPENVIDGSARASVSVLGDILGRALQNLDGLLQMPYGCGEQNMALLAPNIYILQYLKDTDQLTPAISEKATNFLVSGYQRQLNYRHSNGAYSTFGSGPGNTWLTAFVLRTFAKAQSFISIDPTIIKDANIWMESKQQKNGCLQQSGNFLNNRIRGGVSDEVTLTAYITAAFMEITIAPASPMVNKSLSCLMESINHLSNTYTTALLAYVFTLAGDMETRAHLLQHLDTVALDEGGFLHWSQTATETSASLSVEISSYVLLAKLSASPTAEDLGYSSRIVRWLTGQQNYYGGFSSTQDTVVALQALALYSTLVFNPEGSSTVTVQSPSGQLTFDVNQDNKLLYQEKMLQDVTGEFSLEVKGSACASIQISLHYNIPTPTEVNTLSVEVKPEADCASESPRPKLTLKLKSLYSGEENSTNMVILDIKMLSGFVPQPESLKSLQHSLLVNRVEPKEDRVLLYIQELEKNVPTNHSLELVQEVPVQSLKPAVVQIYDYYQPSDHAETEYIYPCAAA